MLEVAYRATGGAAQNISMADMIATREKNTIWYPLWVCTDEGRTRVEEKGLDVQV